MGMLHNAKGNWAATYCKTRPTLNDASKLQKVRGPGRPTLEGAAYFHKYASFSSLKQFSASHVSTLILEGV